MPDDYGSSTSAPNLGLVTVGGAAVGGNREEAGDVDWFRVTLTAGQSYIFRNNGVGGFDPALSLLDPNGVSIPNVGNDDANGSVNSEFRFTCTLTGTYFLRASSVTFNETGAYAVSAAIDPNPPTSNDDYSAQAGTPGLGVVTVGGGAVSGRREVAGDEDWFRVTLNAGTTYVFSMDRGTMDDPFLGLLDANGIAIANASNDDANGTNNSQFSFTPTVTGTYHLRATSLSGSDIGTYTVRVAIDGAPPQPPVDDYGAQAGATNLGSVTVGGSSTGTLESGGDHDWFAVTLSVGSIYQFNMNGNTLSDPRFTLRNSIGNSLVGDDDSGPGNNSQLTFEATSSGTYYIDANSPLGTATGTYSVAVTLVYGAPVIVNNTGSTAAEGGTDVITSAELSTTDPDTAAANIVYTLTTLATNGSLTRNGTAIALNGTFTQAEINSGFISYVHNGSETTSASFGFSVTDGTTTFSGRTFNITVTPVNDAPVVDLNGAAAGINNTAAYTEQASAVTLASGLVLSDADSATLTGAQVRITTGLVAPGGDGADMLAIAGNSSGQVNGISYSYNAATGTLTLAGNASVAAYQALLSQVTFASATNNPGTSRVVTWSVSDGAATSTAATTTITVTPTNDAPTISNLAGDAATYVEGSASRVPLDVGQNATVADFDNANFNGGSLTVAITNAVAGDELWFGARENISNTQTQVTFNGQAFASFNAVGSTRVFTFNSNATPAAVAALIRAMEYVNSGSDNNVARSITFTLTDGSGGTTTATTSVAINAVNDAPVNSVPGAQSGLEDTNLVFSTANGNAILVSDVDATNLTVTLAVANGTLALSGIAGISFSAGANNSSTMTFSGSIAAVRTALDGLTYRGNADFSGADTLTITTSDNGQTGTGGTRTDQDSVAITLLPEGTISGTGADNNFTGTPNPDFFDLRQGGADTVSGLDGNDGFYFGGAYTSADSVDGGAGTVDQVGLQGNYAGGITLGSLTGVEYLVLLPGSDNRFGDRSGALYDYNITSGDLAVGNGQTLIVQANSLRVGEDLTFNGSGETDAAFIINAGFGVDLLTGGSGNDGFLFGQGRFGASDIVNGGAGTDDQLGLQGNFTGNAGGSGALTFGANQLVGIETIVLIAANDSRYGQFTGTVGYDLTMNNGNVAANQTMIISANVLLAGENLTFNGSAELDGRFEIYAGGGVDVITGGSGDDIIFGGGSGDTLRGGAGNDTFGYANLTDSNSAQRDGIQDFTLGDLIDLSLLDANSLVDGNQDFTFIGTDNFGNVAGQLRYQSGGGNIILIQGDVDGDNNSDFEISVVITDGRTLSSTDFIGVVPQPGVVVLNDPLLATGGASPTPAGTGDGLDPFLLGHVGGNAGDPAALAFAFDGAFVDWTRLGDLPGSFDLTI